jgi:hypothetical protein
MLTCTEGEWIIFESDDKKAENDDIRDDERKSNTLRSKLGV